MRIKNILIAALLMVSLFSVSGFSYERFWTAEYQIAFPAFGHEDFIQEPSFLGWAFSFSEAVSDVIYLGGYFGWSTFYEDLGMKTYSEPGHDKTVHVWRQSNLFPVMFVPTVMLLPDSPVKPFVGLGIGAYFTHKQSLEGFWDNIRSGVNFGLRPEVGVQGEFGVVGVKLSGAFNGVVNNNASGAVVDISDFSINLGVVFGR
jgi:hypothetical protein